MVQRSDVCGEEGEGNLDPRPSPSSQIIYVSLLNHALGTQAFPVYSIVHMGMCGVICVGDLHEELTGKVY